MLARAVRSVLRLLLFLLRVAITIFAAIGLYWLVYLARTGGVSS